MNERLLKFTSVDPQPPRKRDADARVGDFQEIYEPFAEEAASTQASRCSQCGVPFCQSGCPLNNNIPDWLQLAAVGRLEEAYQLSSATNPMPEVCGRICPQDRLCEDACVIEQSKHGSVTIGAVEKHITDTAWAEGWVPPVAVGPANGRSVGIIGAGPAGLAAAERLRELGYSVTIYDRHDRVGGLLIYGIPHFKLDKDVVGRRSDRLAQAGVDYRLKFEIGRDATLQQLRDNHDAVLIAIGVYHARQLQAPGAGSTSVIQGMEFLTASNRRQLGDVLDGFSGGPLDASGKNVIVIGGGDTAMDCVRTATRQGATSVTCLYRRDRVNMPGSAREVRSAEEEGVRFEWLAAPKAILGDSDRINGVRAMRIRLGPPDASGRQTPEETPGSDFDLPADMVIQALGFDPEDAPRLFGAPELAVTRRGTLAVEPNPDAPSLDFGAGETNLPGVFAAGDIVRGASLVVWALKDGLNAADHIHARLAATTSGRVGEHIVAAE